MLSAQYLHSTSTRPPLRIGVLLDGPELLRIFAQVLRDIQESNFAKLEYVIYNTAVTTGPAGPRRSLPAKLAALLRDSQRREGLAWDQYQKIDARLSGPCSALEMEDGHGLFEGIDSIEVQPLTSRFVHRFPEDSLQAVQSKQLDVLLRFGFNILRGGILQAAKYGVWSFHHGDNDHYRGGPAHFWELYEDNPLSGTILQVLTEKLDDGKVLAKGLFATQRGLSVNSNRLQPYWGTEHFIIQKLWELHQLGEEQLSRRSLSAAPYLGKRKIYRRPSNAEMIRWAVPKLIAKAGARAFRSVQPARVEHWRIAVRTQGPALLERDEASRTNGFEWIESPRGHYYADPFLREKDGKTWLFYEDCDYASGRGVIACGSLEGGRLVNPRTVLDTQSHASYPYIFDDQGSIYMIPETRALKCVRLYKAVQFPYEWAPVADLFEGQAVDTSVWKQDGLWWFFTTLLDPRSRAAFLYLYFAETLTGPWRYHPANPISADVRDARGAGALFRHGEKLIRPSQSCSPRYGYSTTLKEITRLTSDDYQERPLLTIEPVWQPGMVATHTYNRSSTMEVMDGQTTLPARQIL